MIKCIQIENIDNEFAVNMIISKFKEKFTTKFIESYRNNSDLYIELEESCINLFLSETENLEIFLNIPELHYQLKFQSIQEIKESKFNRNLGR